MSQEAPRDPGGTRRSQKEFEPRGARKSQEEPGRARRNQQELGGPRRTHPGRNLHL